MITQVAQIPRRRKLLQQSYLPELCQFHQALLIAKKKKKKAFLTRPSENLREVK